MFDAIAENELPEMKPPVTFFNLIYETWPMMAKFSKILKLQPVMAFVLRIITNCQRKMMNCGVLSAADISSSLRRVVQIVQSATLEPLRLRVSKSKLILN
jgi:hypothetical protein